MPLIIIGTAFRTGADYVALPCRAQEDGWSATLCMNMAKMNSRLCKAHNEAMLQHYREATSEGRDHNQRPA